MSINLASSTFAKFIEATLLSESSELARKWLDALRARLPERSERIFPDETLLNHVPLLLRRISETLTSGLDITQDDFVRQEMRALADLRRSQGYDIEELVQEFDLLGGIVAERVEELCAQYTGETPPLEVLAVVRQMQRALDSLTRLIMRAFRRGVTSEQLDRAAVLNSVGRTVAHELRTRLHTSLLLLESYREQAVDGDSVLLDRLGNSLRRIENVVSDVFAVAVMQGRADPDGGGRRPLDEVLGELVDELREFAGEERVELRLQADLPRFVVDASRLQLVLMNLLGNAIKYSDPTKSGSWVAISVEPTEVPRRWNVLVRDNGIGIKAGEQSRIFDRNVRGSGIGSRDGQGLGLALAQEAAIQLGSALTVSSREGEGSTFCFALNEPARSLD